MVFKNASCYHRILFTRLYIDGATGIGEKNYRDFQQSFAVVNVNITIKTKNVKTIYLTSNYLYRISN